jgi:hypothetical protein
MVLPTSKISLTKTNKTMRKFFAEKSLRSFGERNGIIFQKAYLPFKPSNAWIWTQSLGKIFVNLLV